MDDIFVARIMSTDVYTVAPDTLVEDAAQRMLAEEIGSVVVVGTDNDVLGILTSTDFVQIVAEREPKDQTPVSRYMSTGVITTDAQATIAETAAVMTDHGFHHLPVVDDEEGVVGMLSTTDLATYLSEAEIVGEAD